MNGQELSYIKEQFIELKATLEERWKNHATRGDRIDHKIDGIFEILGKLSCQKNRTDIVWLKGWVAGLWGLLLFSLVLIIRYINQ